MTPVSRVSCWACAVESSLADVTHLTTRADMLTGGGLTTFVITGGFRTRLERNSL